MTDPSQQNPSSSSTTLADTAMDADLDPEIDLAGTLPTTNGDDPNNPEQSTRDINMEINNTDDEIPESREPTRKDISLRDFLGKMDEYAPIIPDAVTSHHLLLAGLNPHTTPLPLQRLLALATQKFIADIAADAYQYSRMRSSNTGAGAPSAAAMAGAVGAPPPEPTTTTTTTTSKKDDAKSKSSAHILGVQRAGYGGGGASGGQGGRAVLTMEDLGCAVGEYGVNVKRGEFYR